MNKQEKIDQTIKALKREPEQHTFLKFQEPYVPKSKMILVSPEIMSINSTHKIPNFWWRWCQYLILGIKWENLEK